ncbi:MAG: alpha/beta hydrolase [Thermomicrobiales bacterium]
MTAPAPLERDIQANGLRLHYLDWGGAGPPIVLLHGLRDQAHEWDPLAPALTPLGRVLALDQRGHGENDTPPGGYAPDDFAADLAAFCDALALDRPVIIGHSLGGRVAYHFAVAYPERLRALVLIDIGAGSSPETIPAVVAFIEATAGPFANPDDALRALLGGRLLPNAGTAHYLRHNLRQGDDGLWCWKYDLDAAIAAVRAGRGRVPGTWSRASASPRCSCAAGVAMCSAPPTPPGCATPSPVPRWSSCRASATSSRSPNRANSPRPSSPG